MLTRIEVDMEVTRYKVYANEGAVSLWGYVGDYEVCTTLSLRDAHDKCVISDEEYADATKAAEKYLKKGARK